MELNLTIAVPDLMMEAVWRLDEALASLSPKLRYPWIVSNVEEPVRNQ